MMKDCEANGDFSMIDYCFEQTEGLSRQAKKLMSNLKLQLVGRLFRFKDTYQTEIFEITQFNPEASIIQAKRLFDSNNILLDQSKHTTGNIQDFSTNEDFFSKYQIIDHASEIEIRQKLQQTNKNMFIFNLKYQVDEEGICMPLEINPKHININDYKINFNKVSRQVEIHHNKCGPVMFKATELDADLGYMLGSTMRIFTSIYTHEQSGT